MSVYNNSVVECVEKRLVMKKIISRRLLFILTIQERSYQTDDDFTAFGNNMEVTYDNSAFSQAKDVHEWN